MKTVSFTAMENGTRADYQLLAERERSHAAGLPERILGTLERLETGLGGYQVSRLTHSLQTATRAEQDGAGIEWVAAALVHDIGDDLAPWNHSQFAATILRPYVNRDVTYVVEMHGLFQLYYYGHHVGLDQNARQQHLEHPCYDLCVRFCERWDQPSFDPDFVTQPLSYFAPLVREIFTRTPFDPAITGEQES